MFTIFARSLLFSTLALAVHASAQDDCGSVNDLYLVNGRIHTMDESNDVVSTVRVQGNRIVGINGNMPPLDACTRTIDLKGRTVVPGLIDNHNHIVLLGLRPGHDTRLENARSIADVQQLIRDRAQGLGEGEWITAIGGFDTSQFTPAPAAPRFPTLEELDAAAPGHPVYMQVSFAGPGATNSLGREYLISQGVEVGEDGSIAGGAMPNPATKTLYALRQLQDMEDQKRGTLDALRYAASLGLTTHLDQGGFPATGTDADGAANMDTYRAHDAVQALWQEGRLINRIRINFLHMESDPQTPQLQARLDNVFPHFGDDMLRVTGIGEMTASNSAIMFSSSEEWINGTRRVAEAGWRNENHSLTADDYKVIIDGWQQVNDELGGEGIGSLGWVVAHVPFIDEEYALRLKALGGGVSVLGGWRYISGSEQQNGPPFRLLRDSGIPMGMSSDGMQISPMNPWLGLYYVVTGRNARDELINAGQTLSRQEALELYTSANAWFIQEDDLGRIAPGMLADLVVLNADYFDEEAVTDSAIRDIHSLLTIVDGKIVHGEVSGL